MQGKLLFFREQQQALYGLIFIVILFKNPSNKTFSIDPDYKPDYKIHTSISLDREQ